MKYSLITVFVFHFFILQAQIQIGYDIPGIVPSGNSGRVVSMSEDGSKVAISEVGKVRVFTEVAGIWNQLGNDIDHPSGSFGRAISLSENGSRIAIGNSSYDEARVYEYNGSSWIEIGNFVTPYYYYYAQGSGVSLSADGKRVAISAPLEGYYHEGDVRVYEENNGVWTQVLLVSGGYNYSYSYGNYPMGEQLGGKIDLSADGKTLAMTAIDTISSFVKVYAENNNGSWSKKGNDIIGNYINTTEVLGFSISVSSNGNQIAIGAHANDGNGTYDGFARIYEDINNTWTQIGSDLDGVASGDGFGSSVSLSGNGDRVVIGAPSFGSSQSNQGYVKTFDNIGGTWTQIGITVYGKSQTAIAGRSVSISADGGRIAVGSTGSTPFNNMGNTAVYQFDSIPLSPIAQFGYQFDVGLCETQVQFLDSSLNVLGTPQWSFPGGTPSFSTTNNPIIAYSVPGTYQATMIVSNGFAADTTTQTIVVQINPILSLSLSSTNLTCAGTNDGEATAISNNGNPPFNYLWSNGQTSSTISNLLPGVYQVSVEDAIGCSATSSVNIQIGGNYQIGTDLIGEAQNDQFGNAVSISADGKRVAIGAKFNDGNGINAGHVRIFEKNGTVWTQIGPDIDGDTVGDQFGFSVAISADGKRVAIGAPYHASNGNITGQVKLLEENNGAWIQIGNMLLGEASGDFFGNSVAISADGKRVAIGARTNSANGYFAGHLRIFEEIAGTWIQIGSDIDGEASYDYFGSDVSLSADGKRVAAGANGNDNNGPNAGHVRIFEENGGAWTQIGNSITGDAGDQAGFSVSLSSDGKSIAVGAPNNNVVANYAGLIRVFKEIGGTWTQFGNTIYGEAPSDRFGKDVSLSLNGNLVAGAANSTNNIGRVRIFEAINGGWNQFGNNIDGNAVNQYYGSSVSLSFDGQSIAIGAPGSSSSYSYAQVQGTGLTDAIPDFDYSISGNSVSLINNSINATSYSWDFGDNNSSTQTNPVHTYSAVGNYTIVLTATNECDMEQFSQTIVIGNLPSAGFTASNTNGCAPLIVTFSDQSTNNPSSWDWSFPGGTPTTSTLQNPQIQYNAPGSYSATLTATNVFGSDTENLTNFIVVNDTPTALFSHSVSGYTVSLTNNSTNATSYFWDFGDSNTSTQMTPTYTYSSSGTYTVILTATNDCGSTTYSQTFTILISDIEEQQLLSAIAVLPNPNSGDFLLQLSGKPNKQIELQVLNSIGEKVYQQTVDFSSGTLNTEINLGRIPAGTYILSVRHGETMTFKKIAIIN